MIAIPVDLGFRARCRRLEQPARCSALSTWRTPIASRAIRKFSVSWREQCAVKRRWATAADRPARYPRQSGASAAVWALEPIFVADLQPEQYAYRKDRSALDAVRHVHKLINTGHREIVDADLSSYLDEIPHAELSKSVARRVVDGAMLHLIKMWLEAPVEETDERGNKRQSTRNRDKGRGTPQGSPVTPLTQKVISNSRG